MKNDFQPVVGRSLQSSRRRGRHVSTARCSRSSRRRRCPTPGRARRRGLLKSVVTFTLTPTPAGTRLRMEQAGFRPEQEQAFGGAKVGWGKFFARLEEVVGRGE